MRIKRLVFLLLFAVVGYMAFVVVGAMLKREADPSMELVALDGLWDGWNAPAPESVLCWFGWRVGGHNYQCPNQRTWKPTRFWEGSHRSYAPQNSTFLAWPLDAFMLSSLYGDRIHPIYGGVRFHEGIDVPCNIGDPVYATANGQVVFAGMSGTATTGAGNMILLDHGGDWGTQSMHLSEILVQKWQRVEAGQIIGKCGNTGGSTGSHLHFEIMSNWPGPRGRAEKGKMDPLSQLPTGWYLSEKLKKELGLL